MLTRLGFAAAEDAAGGGKGKGKRKRKRFGDDGLLFQVHWHRIVLDEAQMIKNHRTKVAQAAWRLHANHRWLLSGTPIQNSVLDLYSYFRFLRWAPFHTLQTFKCQIADPVKSNPEKGFKRLQGILQVRRAPCSCVNDCCIERGAWCTCEWCSNAAGLWTSPQ